jgi:hypothetical protein
MRGYFNISGELVQQLVYPKGGGGESINKISLTNIQKVAKCKVDLYVEKRDQGKIYLLKSVELPIGVTLIYDCVQFQNTINQYGLFIKLTNGDTFTLTGSIDPIADQTVTGVNTLFLSEVSVGDEIRVTGETRVVASLTSDTELEVTVATTDTANDTSPDVYNPIALVDVIIN